MVRGARRRLLRPSTEQRHLKKKGSVTRERHISRYPLLGQMYPQIPPKMTHHSPSDYERSVRSYDTGGARSSSTRLTERPRPRSPPGDSYVASVSASRVPAGLVLVKRVTETWDVVRYPATKARAPSYPSPPRSAASSTTATPSQRPPPLLLLPPPSAKSHRSDRSPSRASSTVKASSHRQSDRSPSRASSRSEASSRSQSHDLTESALRKMGGSTCGERVGNWADEPSIGGESRRSSKRKDMESLRSSRH
jgi:hypothetical protein